MALLGPPGRTSLSSRSCFCRAPSPPPSGAASPWSCHPVIPAPPLGAQGPPLPRSAAGPVTVSPGLSARPCPSLSSVLSEGLFQRVWFLGCCTFWAVGGRRALGSTTSFPSNTPYMNRDQTGCFSRVLLVTPVGQRVGVPPCAPRTSGSPLPDPATLFPISTKTFTSKLPVEFPGQEARGLWLLSP